MERLSHTDSHTGCALRTLRANHRDKESCSNNYDELAACLIYCVPHIILFHAMWNKGKRGTSPQSIASELKRRLPASWSIKVVKSARRNRQQTYDALIEVAGPKNLSATLVVEIKRRIEPKDVPVVVAQIRRQSVGFPFVAAPFLSPRTRELLIDQEANYLDATGNLRLALDQPAVFIEIEGAEKNPWPEKRPLASLKGPTTGRVIRGLCDLKPPYGIRELAERTNTSLGSVSRVTHLLSQEALITKEDRGRITQVEWPALLRRWVQEYSFTASNQANNFLEPRGLSSLLMKLRDTSLNYAVSGSLAATQISPVAAPRLAAVYVEDVFPFAKALDLRPTESGTNVILAEPFDSVVFERTCKTSGVVYAALSQVVADLLTSSGRGPNEAEELIVWMKQNEDEWRN